MNIKQENKEVFNKYVAKSMIKMTVAGFMQIADKLVAVIFLSTAILSAMQIITPIFMLYIAFPSTIIMGLSVLMNYLIGKNEIDKARGIASFVLILMTIISAIITTITIVFSTEILHLLKMPEEYMESGRSYLIMIGLMFPGLSIGYTLDTIIVANGSTKYSLYLQLSNSIGNVLLNILFVAVFQMGIFGLGLATFLSSVIMCVVAISYFIFVKEKKISPGKIIFSLKEFFEIIYNGISEFFATASQAVMLFVVNIAIMDFLTKEHFEAYSLITLVSTILIQLLLGGAFGVLPKISENYGLGKPKRGLEITKYSIKKVFIIVLIAFVVLIPAIKPLIGLFTKNNEVIDYAFQIYLVYGLSIPIATVSFFASIYFTALKKPITSILVSVVRTAILLPISVYISIKLLGINGIGIGFIIIDILLLGIYWYMMINVTNKLENKVLNKA